MTTQLNSRVRSVVRYVSECGIKVRTQERPAYSHMSAILADAVLQAGLNYQYVVRPRIDALLSWFPAATTTSDLLDLIGSFGAATLLQWRHPEKPKRFAALTSFLYVHAVDTDSDLRQWLHLPENRERLGSLRGVGPKTLDYIQSLVGIQAVAVDRHLKTFVKRAGVAISSYEEVKLVIEAAADEMNVSHLDLDSALWNYMAFKSPAGRKL